MLGAKIYAKIKDALISAINLCRKNPSRKLSDVACLECDSMDFVEKEILINEIFCKAWFCTRCNFSIMDDDQMNKLFFETHNMSKMQMDRNAQSNERWLNSQPLKENERKFSSHPWIKPFHKMKRERSELDTMLDK